MYLCFLFSVFQLLLVGSSALNALQVVQDLMEPKPFAEVLSILEC